MVWERWNLNWEHSHWKRAEGISIAEVAKLVMEGAAKVGGEEVR